jgi:hypothetical protein
MDIKLKMLPEGLELKGLSSPDKSLELTLHCTPVTQVTNVAPELAALKETITSLEEQLNSFDFASAESGMAKSEDASVTKRLAEVEKQLDVLGITSDFKERLEQELHLLGITADFTKPLEQQLDVFDISTAFTKRLADVEQQLHLLGITSDFKKRVEQQLDVIDISSEFVKRLADLEKQVADWDASGDEDSDEDDEDDKKHGRTPVLKRMPRSRNRSTISSLSSKRKSFTLSAKMPTCCAACRTTLSLSKSPSSMSTWPCLRFSPWNASIR